MNIRVFDTSHDAGIYVAALAEQVILTCPNPVLGLATGRTPIPFYEALVRLHRCGLDLSTVTTINLDEYIGLAATHEQSYSYFMHQYLFSKTNIPSQNIHIPNGMADNVADECMRYDEIIRAHPINLQILGIGINGHIGFNEPDDLLLSKTHVVHLKPETVKSNASFFKGTENVPRQAVTMGVQAILQADQIVLMAFGTEKARVVTDMVMGEIRTDLPASILQLHKRVTVVLDNESAQGLTDENGAVFTK